MKVTSNIQNYLLTIVFLLFVITGTATADIIIVDDDPGADHISIQEAINNSDDGDTILVYPGTYVENVDVYRELTIRSESGNPNDTIIQAEFSDDNVFYITADNVSVSGFTITGADFDWPCSGIYLEGVQNSNISDNRLSSNCYGIYMSSSDNSTISNNTVTYNEKEVGIYLEDSNNNRLYNNVAENNAAGILLYDSEHNELNDNIASYNSYYGILLMAGNNELNNNVMSENMFNFGGGEVNDIDTSNLVDGKPVYYLMNISDMILDNASNAGTIYCIDCQNVSIMDQSLTNNGFGIFFDNTTGSDITDNIISDNEKGIYLMDSGDNYLKNNTISGNFEGISLSGSIENTLNDNIVSDNEVGIFVGDNIEWDDETGNTIIQTSGNNTIFNNLFSNTHNAFLAGDMNLNIWNISKTDGMNIVGGSYLGGNYWAMADGTGFSQSCNDGDGDGICDSAYVIGVNNIDHLPLKSAGMIPPIAHFKANVTSGATPLTVQFTDLSLNDPVSWEWDVDGDGEIDYTAQDPVHVYGIPGTYNITLTVSNEMGTDTKTECCYIAAGKELICIDGPIYSGSDLNMIIGSQDSDLIEMDAISFPGFCLDEKMQIFGGNFVQGRTIMENGLRYHTGIVQSDYQADFADEANTYNYKDAFPQIGIFGDKYVSLADEDAGELIKLLMDSSETHVLRNGEPLELPEGYSIAAKQIDVEEEKVWMEFTRDGVFLEDQVIDIAAGDATWDYDVDVGDQDDVIVLRVLVTGISQLDTSVTIEGLWLTDFQNIREIDTADRIGILEVDSVSNSLSMVNHEPVYLMPDSTHEIAEGFKFRVMEDIENLTFHLSRCTESLYPIADFAADTRVGIAPLTVQFTDHSTNSDSWEWDVDGDGLTDHTTQNPIHVYDNPGNYTVTLTVSNELGDNTETKEGYIRVIKGAFTLQPGWNLISFPREMDVPDIDHVLQDFNDDEVDMVFYDDAHSGMMLVPEGFEALKGYWVHNNMSENAVINELYLEPEVPCGPPSLTLYPGWNAIGHTATVELPAIYALCTIDDSYVVIKGPWMSSENCYEYFGYNNREGAFGGNQVGEDLFNMRMYEGYYVFVDRECVLA